MKSEKSIQGLTLALKKLFLFVLPSLNFQLGKCENGAIVLVHFDSLGDAILFSPVIRSTRQTFLDSKIHLVTLSERLPLYKNCPYLDGVAGVKTPKMFSTRSRHYYLLICTYLYLLVKFRGKVQKVIGPSWLLFDSWHEFCRDLLHANLDLRSEFKELPDYISADRQHQVRRMLSLAGVMGVHPHGEHLEVWLDQHRIHPKKEGFSVALLLGSGHPRRSWPTKRYVELAFWILDNFQDSEIMIFGQSEYIKDPQHLFELKVDGRIHLLMDKTDLPELRSRLETCRLVVGNDSGVVHLASALLIPCVVISSHSEYACPWNLHSPNRYHPWMVKHQVIQPKSSNPECLNTCSHAQPHCILEIETQNVINVVRYFLTNSD